MLLGRYFVPLCLTYFSLKRGLHKLVVKIFPLPGERGYIIWDEYFICEDTPLWRRFPLPPPWQDDPPAMGWFPHLFELCWLLRKLPSFVLAQLAISYTVISPDRKGGRVLCTHQVGVGPLVAQPGGTLA